MRKVFDQFHFSLLEKEQGDLLERRMSREEWLRSRFQNRFAFSHYGKDFYWVPQSFSQEFIVGIVERKKSQNQRTPPDEGAKEFEGHYWTGSMVIIDPIDRADGQRVAFEDQNSVGEPKAILASLVLALNQASSNQYTVFFKALFRGDSFWRFANKHGGQLEYVAFKFTVPNMIFGAGGSVKQGLRRIGKDTDADEVEVKIESEKGVKTDSEAIKEGVAYGEEGNARVTARSMTGEYWSSTQRKLSVKMDRILNLAEAKAGDVRQWLKQALARDEDSINSNTDVTDGSAGMD